MKTLHISKLTMNNYKNDDAILGSWCKDLYSYVVDNEEFLINYNLSVDIIINREEETRKIIKYFLKELSITLNKYHNCYYSQKFWNILLSNWTTFIIDIFHYLYTEIKKLDLNLKEQYIVYTDSFFPYTKLYQPKQNSEGIIDDNYIHSIVSFVIENSDLKNIKFEKKDIIKPTYDSWFKILEKKRGKKNIVKKIIHKIYWSILKAGKTKYLLYGISGVNTIDLIKLKILNPKICFSYKNFSCEIKEKKDSSKKLELYIDENNEFINILKKFIEYNIPNSILENFKKNIDNSNDYKEKKVVLPSPGFYQDEQLFEVALAKENGALTAYYEEGASMFPYSSGKSIYQFETMDYFLSWGTKHFIDNLKHINISSKRFSKKQTNTQEYDNILYYPSAQLLTPHVYGTYNLPTNHKYYIDKSVFISNIIKSNLKNKLIVKPKHTLEAKPNGDEYGVMDKFNISYNIKLDRKVNIQNCSLFLVDHLGSAIIEAMFYNTPTMIFLDYEITRPSKHLEYFLNKFEKEGVFFRDPKKAAKQIISVYGNRVNFWNQKSIQNIRKEFLETYLPNKGDWKNTLNYALKQIERESFENK